MVAKSRRDCNDEVWPISPNPAEPEPKGFVQKLAILLFGKRICFVQYLMREIQLTGLFSRHGEENFPHKVLITADNRCKKMMPS